MFSDLDMLILPDEFTIGGIIVGLGLALLVPVPALFSLGPESRTASLAESAIGAFVPAGALWLMGWLFEKIRRKEGLGFGDVKMIAMIGAFLGIRGALLTVVLGSVLGSVIGLAYIKLTKRDTATYQLPFGTFLGVAALIAAMAGEGLMGWYGG
jgi:leader peptidase (prepilin peptidase)/N-methyltransferase